MKTYFLIVGIGAILLGSCDRNTVIKKEPEFRQLKMRKKNKDSAKKGFYIDIHEAGMDNFDFRSVLYTGKYMQLAIMNLEPGEDVGWTTHKLSDQYMRVESGTGLCLLNDEEYELSENDAVFIPAGAQYNILNDNDSIQLKLSMLYARPVHKDGISRSTKEEAQKKKEYFDRETTE